MFDRDEQEISQIIETGLKAVRSGKTTLEQFLSQYPDQADEIRPEIAAALWLIASQREVESRPGFVTASRKRVLDRIKTEARDQGARRAFFGIAWPRQIALQWVVAALFLVVILTGAGSVVSFSQASLPGDNLYAVKRISEQVAYTVTLNDIQRVQLSAEYADRRLTEVETLVAKHSYQKAGAALQEFKQQVAHTVALLEDVSNSQAMPKLTMAVALKEQLTEETTRLQALVISAPPNLHVDLIDAQGATTLGAAATTAVIKDIPEATLTMFPTFTGTELVIETPVPSDTPEPVVEPSEEPSDEPVVTEESTSEPGAQGTLQPSTSGAAGEPLPAQNTTKTVGRPTRDPKLDPLNTGKSNDNTDKTNPGKGNDGNPPGKDK